MFPDSVEAAAGLPSKRRKAPSHKPTRDDRPKAQPIKFVQKLAYRSKKWRDYFGMRSLVESSNNLLKTDPHGDIENTRKRSGRGYTATYLALTFAVVASNLKRIESFFVAEAKRIQEKRKPQQRMRRRRDRHGAPLLRLDEGPPAQTE